MPADKAVYLDAYNYATVNTLSTPINFGSIHAGDSFGTQAVTVQNTAPSGAYTETLAAGFGTPPTGFTASGSIAGLAGQATDNTSMTVGISDTTAGHKSGTVAVNLTSKAVGGSGLSDTPLPSQTVTVTGDVYDYAVPYELHTPLDIGNIHAGGSFRFPRAYPLELGPGQPVFGVLGRQFGKLERDAWSR